MPLELPRTEVCQRNGTFLLCCFVAVNMGPRVLFLPEQYATTEPQPRNYAPSGVGGGQDKIKCHTEA